MILALEFLVVRICSSYRL